jgi:hypothetical protein
MKTITLPVHSDIVGKPFRVEYGGMRRCIVCEELFSREEAPKHSSVSCFPEKRIVPQRPQRQEQLKDEASRTLDGTRASFPTIHRIAPHHRSGH